MRNQVGAYPLMSSILSTTNGSTQILATNNDLNLSKITNKEFTSSGQESTTDGHLALDPLWVNSSHLQVSTNDWSKMTFDPEYGLATVPPPSFDHNHNISSNQHWPLLDDEDLLSPLQESTIANVDIAKFKTSTQKDLDTITPVPVSYTESTGNPSRHSPSREPPLMVPSTQLDYVKTLQPQGQGQKEQIEQKQTTSLLRPRIIKEVKFNQARRKSTREVKPPINKQVSPNMKGVKKPTKSLLNAVRPGFANQQLRKICSLMKRLDTENPILTTPPEEALMVAQQRQQCLQSLNIALANLNKRESGTIFALYHRHPFPKYQNLMISEIKEDSTNSSCESITIIPA